MYLRNTVSQNDVLCDNNNLYLLTRVAAFAELRRNKHLDESRYRIGPPEVTRAKRFWRDVMWQLCHSCTTSDFHTNVASENHSEKLTTSGRLCGVMWQRSASAGITSFHASRDNADTSRPLRLDCPMSGSSAENLVTYLTSDVLSVININTTVFWYVYSCCLVKKIKKKAYAFLISVESIILLYTKWGLDKSHGKYSNLLKNTKNWMNKTHHWVKTCKDIMFDIWKTTSMVYSTTNILQWGHAVAQLVESLRYNRKVAGSIPNGVTGIFHWHNLSGRTMTLGLTQPLTEMSTRNISWG